MSPAITRAGFTMIELMVIVVIMAILAGTVIPVMDQSTQARQGASRDEVVRSFEFARAFAIAGGVPAGVAIDTSESTLGIVTLNDSGAIIPVVDRIDGQIKEADLSQHYAGVTIVSFVNGNGTTGDGTVWFDFQAEPHTRVQSSGAFDAVFNQNATLTMSTGTTITVHAGSGLVED